MRRRSKPYVRSPRTRKTALTRTARIPSASFAKLELELCIAMIPPISPPDAVVVDTNLCVAVAAKETDKQSQASARLAHYTALGYEFFAPGVLVSETLYVLCKKLEVGTLTPATHAQAIADFHTFLSFIQPPPNGEIALVLRAEAIRGSYTCRRSADGLYIALAEELSVTRPTVLLTFDEDMAKQAARN